MLLFLNNNKNKMPFSSEDKVIIKHYRLDEGYCKRKVPTKFPNVAGHLAV